MCPGKAVLWSQANQPALAYLRGRGLQDETINCAYLGYDPGRKAIIIPWYIEGELWRLGAKSLLDTRKAPLFAGFKQGLYNVHRAPRNSYCKILSQIQTKIKLLDVII